MHCHLGDFAEYAALRRRVSEREKALARQGIADSREAAAAVAARAASPATSSRCRPGGGPAWPSCSTRASTATRDPRPLVLTEDRWAGRLSAADFPVPVEALGPDAAAQARRPPRRRACAATSRRRCATPASSRPPPAAPLAAAAAADDPELATLRRALRAHPCHGCDDREAHARWAERHARLERETEQLRQKVRATTHSLARAFDRIRALLAERGYLDGETRHRRRARGWPGCGASPTCSPPSACATACGTGWSPPSWPPWCRRWCTSRAGTTGRCRGCPSGAGVRRRCTATVRLWAELEADERRHRVERTREPDLGFAWPMHRWARGESLARGADGRRAERRRAVRRRLRPLVPPGARPARPDRRVAGGPTASAGPRRDAVTAVRRGVVAVGTA